MSYSVVQDTVLPQSAMDEMKKCAEYYKKEKTCINWSNKFQGNTTYLEKLKTTLSSKFPRDQSDLWGYIKEIIGYTGEDVSEAPLLAVPKITTSLPGLTTTSANLNSLSSNLMLTSNIANVLFQSGKFPSATSLLGLGDPMSQATLNANNMFLSPSLFKMQDSLNLLKPLSMTPLASTSKEKPKKSHDIKMDFSNDLNALKSKMEFSIPDLSLSKSYASDLALAGLRKMDFLASDLSISSVKPKAEFLDVSPPKIPKTDFGMLDLSHKNETETENHTETEQPLNLAE